MLLLFIRLWRRARPRGWALPVIVVVGVFLTSWPLMAIVEPPGSAIVSPVNYWWWFLITSSTVGYGDYYPTTAAGHVVGAYVVIGGIVTLTMIFATIAGLIESARGRRMRGAVTVTTAGHVLILGYTPGRTEHIVDELLADGRRVALATWDEVTAHPMADRPVDFIRGDLTVEEVLRRAGTHTATSVLVDARDDNETIAVTVSVKHVAPDTHTVVALRDMGRATQVGYLSASAQTVQWHSSRIIAEELQSPGISRVYTELMTAGGQNTYSIRLPDSIRPVSYGDCQVALGRTFEATALAVDTGTELQVSPAWDTPLPSGSVVYYVGRRPISPDRLVRALPRKASGANREPGDKAMPDPVIATQRAEDTNT